MTYFCLVESQIGRIVTVQSKVGHHPTLDTDTNNKKNISCCNENDCYS
jgi:hypothetical protein